MDQSGDIRVLQGALLVEVDPHVVHQDLEHVHGLEEQFHDFRGHVHAALAEFVQDVLADMGQGLDLGQAQEARGALDGVHAAEDAVQDVQIARGLFQGQEVLLDHLEVFLSLHQEVFVEAGVVQGEVAHDSTLFLPWKVSNWWPSTSVRRCWRSRMKMTPASVLATFWM